ncbi:glutamate racemase [Candidatus Saccharibacteria bacterium CG_4_10_14_0_2_um_filter_52_9]|nr:MAG: glutamate racemase [Candidatus Saccharibacteria bacterium CG_4_10_14_0_2_um_filter_52_9]
MKIGVFDSGVGGLSVANAIGTALPDHEVILRDDRKHVPYGLRPPEEILGFVVPIFQELVDTGCQVIVVACNTVTTTLIGELRQRFKIPLVAIEPMVKPAASLTKTKVIAVCATPTTLASSRYAQLKVEFAKDITVLEPDCSDWPVMIEDGQRDQQKIDSRITQVLTAGADVIVLACTHYHWIEDEITKLAKGRAQILQPEPAVIEQLKRVLARLA